MDRRQALKVIGTLPALGILPSGITFSRSTNQIKLVIEGIHPEVSANWLKSFVDHPGVNNLLYGLIIRGKSLEETLLLASKMFPGEFSVCETDRLEFLNGYVNIEKGWWAISDQPITDDWIPLYNSWTNKVQELGGVFV